AGGYIDHIRRALGFALPIVRGVPPERSPRRTTSRSGIALDPSLPVHSLSPGRRWPPPPGRRSRRTRTGRSLFWLLLLLRLLLARLLLCVQSSLLGGLLAPVLARLGSCGWLGPCSDRLVEGISLFHVGLTYPLLASRACIRGGLDLRFRIQ